ncbi:MAG TPA: hypothetical protein VHG69_05655, partial [Thermoleophilaceae bacterium]|nr:hypothetical protein [Thermoleophilaceae bacterium]
MATAASSTQVPPEALSELLERFDPDVIDVPGGTARIRLEVTGQRAWDAVVRNGEVRLRPPAGPE